jgi:O-acetyl-ADP-ribose deacetylase (regulator of RNase III)
MLLVREGDLLSSESDVICQQVNCRNAMGSGLAKAICDKWPVVKTAYHRLCREVDDPYKLLGVVQIVKHDCLPFDVANIFGQLNYGRSKCCYTNYDAIRAAFTRLNELYSEEKVISFPYMFGCGLAGGDWTIVANIMDDCFRERTVNIFRKQK